MTAVCREQYKKCSGDMIYGGNFG